MGNKLLWVGGIHGVGKTSVLEVITSEDSQNIKKVYLGQLFWDTARSTGKQWVQLSKEDKLLEVEDIVTGEILRQARQYNLIIDSHFCVYIGKKLLPGFHYRNLLKIIDRNKKVGIINLIADPHIIAQRRGGTIKKYNNYPTFSSIDKITKELEESSRYFEYFKRAFHPKNSIVIDTSLEPIVTLKMKIMGVYNGI